MSRRRVDPARQEAADRIIRTIILMIKEMPDAERAALIARWNAPVERKGVAA